MKWFQVDSAAPHDPRIRAVRKACGNSGMGALFNLWCFVAEHGTYRPGWSLDSHGNPIHREFLLAASEATEDEFEALLSVLVKTGHVIPNEWRRRGVLAFPAMTKRADFYTQKKIRDRAKTPANQPSTDGLHTVSVHSTENSALQDNTRQHNTNNTKNKYSSARSAEHARARKKTPTTKNADTPTVSYRSVLRVARGILSAHPETPPDFVSLKDAVKTACAAKGVPYDAEVVGKATESAMAMHSKARRH